MRLDTTALEFMSTQVEGPIVLIAHSPGLQTVEAYEGQFTSAIEALQLPADHQAMFLEVVIETTCNVAADLPVRGLVRHGYPVLEARGPAVPDTIAAVLLHIRDVTGLLPHVCFNPAKETRLMTLLPFQFRSEGTVPRITRELLALAEPDDSKRPRVYGG